MKLVLKTITGKQHEVEVEPSTTIFDVKKFVEAEYEPASLRLCYNGAVLEDSNTVASAGLKEGESLVLAGRKRKIPMPPAQPPAEAPKANSSTPSTAATTAAASSTPAVVDGGVKPSALVGITQPKDAKATTVAAAENSNADATGSPEEPSSFLASAAPPATSVPVSTAPVAPPAALPANTFGVPANLIDEICAMGFEDRHQVSLALRAAYMNVDRAVEYLFDGIPPHLAQELTRDNAPTPGTSSTLDALAPTAPATTATAPQTPEAELRAALAGIPQFDQIRALYLQNTATLPVVTQQIALRHPAVYELIERHPETFLAIMSETGNPGTTEGASSQSRMATAAATQGTAGDNGEAGFMSHLPAEVALTTDDHAAVQQLVELGGGAWDEQSALLVYLATQRNQEVAASVLFEHGGVPAELLAEIADRMVEEDEERYGERDGDEQS